MDCITSTVFDMRALRRAEQDYRRRLEQEPGDTASRLGLAWCLVVQALFEAGQEETLCRVPEHPHAPAPPPTATAPAATAPAAERSSRSLLRGSLQQALLVSHLSTDPQEKSDSEWLRTLIRLSGGEKALVEAEEEAVAALRAVTGAVIRTPPDPFGLGAAGPAAGPRPRLRRYCRRASGGPG